MERRMTGAQLRFYMDRLKLFWNQATIARYFEVSPLTVIRWEQSTSLPFYTRLPDFEEALEDLTKELVKKDHGRNFMKRISDALLYDDPPDWADPMTKKRDTSDLRELLISITFGKTVRSTEVLAATDEKGFSRAQVYKYANRLGIKMSVQKLGRGGYSLWTMRRPRQPKEATNGSVRKQREQKPATPVQSRHSERDTQPSAKPHKASPKAKRS